MKTRIIMCLAVAILLSGISSYGNQVSAKAALQQGLMGGSGFAKIMSDKEYIKRYHDGSNSGIILNDNGKILAHATNLIYENSQNDLFVKANLYAMRELKQDPNYYILEMIHADKALSNNFKLVAVQIIRRKHIAVVKAQAKSRNTDSWFVTDSEKLQKHLEKLLSIGYKQLAKIYGSIYVKGKPVRIQYLDDYGFVVYQLINEKVVILQNKSKKIAK